VAGAPAPLGQRGRCPLAIVVRGRMGAEECPLLQDKLYAAPDGLRHLCLVATIFTVLHGMQTRLSACLSVKRVDSDKTEERSVRIFIPYERSCSLVF